MIKLKDVASYVSEKVDTGLLKVQDYITTDNMLSNRGGIIISDSLPKAEKVTKFERGDILVSNIRPYFKKIWYATFNGGCSNDVIVFRANGINSKFLYYVLSQNVFFDYMMAGANGTKMPRGNKKLIPDFEFLNFSPVQQEHISSILSRFDSLIENNQKQINLLEEAARRLYKEWFVDLRFPGHENVEIIEGMPIDWRKGTFESFVDVTMGQSPKSIFYNQDGDGIAFHQGVGSYGDRFVKDSIYSTSTTRIAEAGSILFSVRAPVGRLNITKNRIIIGRGLAALKQKSNYQSFLFYMLKEFFFRDNIVGNGSIFASITKDELLSLSFVFPNENLIKRFNDVAISIDKKIEYLDMQINLLTEARDRLLPKLMSGEIEV